MISTGAGDKKRPTGWPLRLSAVKIKMSRSRGFVRRFERELKHPAYEWAKAGTIENILKVDEFLKSKNIIGMLVGGCLEHELPRKDIDVVVADNSGIKYKEFDVDWWMYWDGNGKAVNLNDIVMNAERFHKVSRFESQKKAGLILPSTSINAELTDRLYFPGFEYTDIPKLPENDINNVTQAHNHFAKENSKRFRKWDGETPYYVHPLWCAMTIASETKLDKRTRDEGFQALLYHDLIEDTTLAIPEECKASVIPIIRDMTFESFNEEMEKIWGKPKEVRLYKLYDKINNLMDGEWMKPEKRRIYEEYTMRLCENVEREYGELNITRIARSILES